METNHVIRSKATVDSNIDEYFITCDEKTIAHKSFDILTDIDIIQNWGRSILDDHYETCPHKTSITLEIPKDIYDKLITHAERQGNSIEEECLGWIYQASQEDGVVF